MNYDHHNGKSVKAVRNHDDRAEITFEDDAVLDIPGNISETLVGQALLVVEDDKLVFGYPQKDKPAMRQTEIAIPSAEEDEDRLATDEEIARVAAGGKVDEAEVVEDAEEGAENAAEGADA